MDNSSINVSLRIGGDRRRIFEAWVNPAVAQQWQCDQVEGLWAAGEKVVWHFGEFRQVLQVLAVEKDSQLEFLWRAHNKEPETRVEIDFLDTQNGQCGVQLRESSFTLSTQELPLIVDHSCGWENMLCRLKVWIELGARFDAARGQFYIP